MRAFPGLESALVVGIGNPFRGDDAAGLQVVRHIARVNPPAVQTWESDGDVGTLLDLWSNRKFVVAVDAVSSGSPPGAVFRYEMTDESEELPAMLGSTVSSHGLGLGEAVKLGSALGRLPKRLIIYGIEGVNFDTGAPLSRSVADAAVTAASGILADLDDRVANQDA